jgi:adenosylhomocysteinase
MTMIDKALTADVRNGIEFKVADLSLAGYGRRDIRLSEHEMPGLMALRREYAAVKPLQGARISGSLHMTVQTAVLIETLIELGAELRWASSNIFSTQDHAAAAVVVGPHGTPEEPKGTSVFAWKGETLEEYWWACEQALTWRGNPASLIVDDGGDATLMVLRGAQFEKAGAVPPAEEDDPTEWQVLLARLRERFETDKGKWTKIAASVKGVSEETTTGVLRLYQHAAAGELPFPAINVNDSVTKSKFDNKYGCRHSLIDGINRGTDVLIGGKKVLICGFGDVGKGCAEAVKGQGARVVVSEIDPINALQALMEGYEVRRVESVIGDADIVVTATGNKDVITLEHMKAMKDQAILGNIGHFDNEIQTAALENSGATKVNIRPQVDVWTFPDTGKSIIMLSEGRLLNLGNATGHPSFVMSNSFSNQVIAQIELWTKNDEYDNEVYRLPKHLDEKVARIHVEALSGELTKLTKEQAEYIGVDVDGPYKPDFYRY